MCPPPVGGQPEGCTMASGAACTGALRRGLVGPYRPMTGVATALARCNPPLSLPMTSCAPAKYCTSCANVVCPARLPTPGCAPAMASQRSRSRVVPHNHVGTPSARSAAVNACQCANGQRFSGLFSDPGRRMTPWRASPCAAHGRVSICSSKEKWRVKSAHSWVWWRSLSASGATGREKRRLSKCRGRPGQAMP